MLGYSARIRSNIIFLLRQRKDTTAKKVVVTDLLIVTVHIFECSRENSSTHAHAFKLLPIREPAEVWRRVPATARGGLAQENGRVQSFSGAPQGLVQRRGDVLH